jgi:DNA-binding GntR family transcriptional regulator
VREEAGACGAFDAGLRRLGLTPRADIVQLEAVTPSETVASALRLTASDQVLIRKRHVFASGEPVLLATSFIPWMLAERAGVTKEDTGPGGTYSRLAEIGHGPVRFTEAAILGISIEDLAELDDARLAGVLARLHAWEAQHDPNGKQLRFKRHDDKTIVIMDLR